MKMKILFFITMLCVAGVIPNSLAQDNTQVGLPEGAIARLGKGGISVMKFLADETHLAVGTDVGVWIYDTRTGKVKHLLQHPRGVDNLVISPDGRILASSGGSSPFILLWNLETGKRIQSLRAEMNNDGAALRFSKDEKDLIGLYSDVIGDTILIRWVVATGEILSKKKGKGILSPLSSAPNSISFAGVTPTGKITLLYPETPKKGVFNSDIMKSIIPRLPKSDEPRKRPDHGVLTLTYSQDSKTVATGGDDRVIRLWDTSTHTEEVTLNGHMGWITSIAFSPDNSIVASGDTDKTIRLWDAKTGKPLNILNGHTHTISVLAFNPDGKTVASGSLDGTIRFWDVKTGKELSIFATDHTRGTRPVAFSTENNTCLTSTYNGTIQTWDIRTGRKLNSFAVAPIALTAAMALSPDASHFVVKGKPNAYIVPTRNGYRVNRKASSGRYTTRLWNLNTESEINLIQNDSGTDKLTFSPDSKVLAAIDYFRGTHLWDVGTGNEVIQFSNRSDVLTFSSKSKILATGGNSDETSIWNVKSGNRILSLATKKAECLAFSPANLTVAVGTRSEVHLWNLNTAQISTSMSMEKWTELNALTFSPDGKTIIVGIRRGEIWQEGSHFGIQLWDVQTANMLGTHSGHSHQIETLQFSHDGEILASSAKDGTVLLWDWEKIISKAKGNKGN